MAGASSVTQYDWRSLVDQTHDLVQQGYQGYPTVQHDLSGLWHASQVARVRASRVRNVSEQVAATKLLASQGFDAGRLNQDVGMLELAPAVEDLFGLDTAAASVDDFLQQIQDMTVLTAIQEAQQDTIASFERVMDEAMQRDWGAEKSRLFGQIAPHGVAGSGQPSGGLFGALTAGAGGMVGGGAAAFGGASGALSPTERRYLEVVQRAQAARAKAEVYDAVTAFGQACAAAAGADAPMLSVWALLSDILAPATAAGLLPGAPGSASQAGYVDALVLGARRHLQGGFLAHVRSTISRHAAAAKRGGDPNPMHDIAAFMAVRFRDKGVVDLEQLGGQDSSWVKVYFCLRAGQDELARKAAELAKDPASQVLTGTLRSLQPLLDQWLEDRPAFRSAHGSACARECERLMRGYNMHKHTFGYDYQVLVMALLAGHAQTLDMLSKVSPGLFATIDDFLWARLTCVAPGGGSGSSGAERGMSSPGLSSSLGSGSPPAYRLSDLQAELNRWPPSYYSRGGEEPLLYVTVCLLSLQWRRALRFLWRDESAKAFRLDAVHLAAALFFTKALFAVTEDTTSADSQVDVGALISGYGRRFVRSDSAAALHYYMLAADAVGGSLLVKGELFRELLVESKDYGTLFGGGGVLGASGALAALMPSVSERRALYESVGYACQSNAQPDEAREAFMAAGRPRAALGLINDQLSAAIAASRGAVTDDVQALITSGQAAVEAIEHGPLPGGDAPSPPPAAGRALDRGEVSAFQQLLLVRQLMDAAGVGEWQAALGVLARVPFVPGERARVAACQQLVAGLPPALRERLPDVLVAAADAARGLKAQVLAGGGGGGGSDLLAVLRQRVECLKLFVLDLDPSIDPRVYAAVNAAVREFS